MRKILITGGPVHAYLDAVKILTNRFQGGLMAELAEKLAKKYECEVTYLTTKSSKKPAERDNLKVVFHDGFEDYRNQVVSISRESTDVILGAAVANLIPLNPWKGKFPSHDYKVGDVIPIDFTIAPRVIEEIKSAAPHVNLFGFKLLAGVEHEELIQAAFNIVLAARATAVIANDAKKGLAQKYAVTKERGVHALHKDDLHDFLWLLMNDQHYKTQYTEAFSDPKEEQRLKEVIRYWHEKEPDLFINAGEGLIFGTIATRSQNGAGFYTTGRGKKELETLAQVVSVDHESRVVTVNGMGKATLNAPLLDSIFKAHPEAQTIVHGHVQKPELPTLDYAQPGTVRDSQRNLTAGSFNVSAHGCFLILDKQGNVVKG